MEGCHPVESQSMRIIISARCYEYYYDGCQWRGYRLLRSELCKRENNVTKSHRISNKRYHSIVTVSFTDSYPRIQHLKSFSSSFIFDVIHLRFIFYFQLKNSSFLLFSIICYYVFAISFRNQRQPVCSFGCSALFLLFQGFHELSSICHSLCFLGFFSSCENKLTII